MKRLKLKSLDAFRCNGEIKKSLDKVKGGDDMNTATVPTTDIIIDQDVVIP